MNEAMAVCARHRWIDFSDNPARDVEDCGREVHRHPEADKATSIRRGNLEQRHVNRQPSTCQKARDLLYRDGHVVELAAACQTAHFATNKKNPMAVVSMRNSFD